MNHDEILCETEKEVVLSKTLSSFYQNENNEDFKQLFQELVSFKHRQRKHTTKAKMPFEEIQTNMYNKLQALLFETISLSNKEDRNQKIHKVSKWFTQTKSSFQSLIGFKIKSTKDSDQIYPEEEEESKDIQEEKDNTDFLHREVIEGFDAPRIKLKEYKAKRVFSFLPKPRITKRISQDNINNDDTMKRTCSGKSIKTGSTGYASFQEAKLFQAKSALSCLSHTETNSKSKLTTFVNPKKEIKSSYSYLRPNPNYNQLAIESEINKSKQRLLSEKLYLDEVKAHMNSFGEKRSRFKTQIKAKYEMKEVISKCKIILKDTIQNEKEEKLRFIKEKKLKEEYKKYQERKRLQEINEKHQKEVRSGVRKAIRVSIKEDIQDSLPLYQSIREKLVEKPKAKTSLSEVKYISSAFDHSNKVVKIDTKLSKEKVFRYNSNDMLRKQIEKRETARLDYNQEMQINLPSDMLVFSTFDNELASTRGRNSNLCSLKLIDDKKDLYKQSCRPLSLFNYRNREIDPIQEEKSRNKSSQFNFFSESYQKNSDNYLQLRKTISSFGEKQRALSINRSLSQTKYTPHPDNNPSVYPLTVLPRWNEKLLSSSCL